jgi:hypothetical protein
MTDPMAAGHEYSRFVFIWVWEEGREQSVGCCEEGCCCVGGHDEPPWLLSPAVPAPTATNPNPRSRTRSERPILDIGHYSPSTLSTTTRIGDLPTRLSGWFGHAFSSSSTDLSLPSLLSQSPQLSSASSSSSSPTKTQGSALLSAAARHRSRHLDRLFTRQRCAA